MTRRLMRFLLLRALLLNPMYLHFLEHLKNTPSTLDCAVEFCVEGVDDDRMVNGRTTARVGVVEALTWPLRCARSA